MVISRSEGAPWPGQHTPVLSGDQDATGWGTVMAVRGRSQAINQALSRHPSQRDAHRRHSKAAKTHNGRFSDPIKVWFWLLADFSASWVECPVLANKRTSMHRTEPDCLAPWRALHNPALSASALTSPALHSARAAAFRCGPGPHPGGCF